MSPTPDDATLAVVVARLDDLRADVQALRSELAAHRVDMVSRGEWEQRNRAVDDRLNGQGREIGDLRHEIRSRRMPWPAVAAAITGVVALAITIVTLITT